MSSAAASNAHDSYDPLYFRDQAAIEDRHFWFTARNRVIGGFAERLTAPLPDGYRVLEVGCGTGNVLRELESVCRRGRVVGMDLFAEGLRFARTRVRCPLVQGDVYRLPFGASFDVVGLFDVLEHLPDDGAILRSLFQLTAPDGALLLTVPAHMSLWSYFDVAAHHCRRYSPTELRARLTEAGFEVEYLTEFMAGLYPLVWVGRRLSSLTQRARGNSDQDVREMTGRDLAVVPVLNGLLTFLLNQEARLLGRLARRGRALPIGTSLLAVARRPKTPEAFSADKRLGSDQRRC